MSRVDALYMSSPVWVQGAMVAVYGWWWHRRRFSSHFRRQVAELKAHDRWTKDELLAYQTAQLSRLLGVARQAPYYGRLFSDAGISPTAEPWAALWQLPFLAKEQLRARPRDLLTAPPPRGTLTFKSSGTTGTPTEIYYTREFHALELASIEARNLNWAGLTYRNRRVMFGARKICRFDQPGPPFWRFSPAENMAYASVYHLSPQFLPAYIDFLRAFTPEVITGYPSALYAIAQYALDRNDIPPKVEAIFTSAERLPNYMRAAIETAWQTRVFDRYGAVEGCVSASQCEHGRYHVHPEIGIVEILDAHGRAVGPGVEGEVVCTGLQNMLQPLIRYRIGDSARWSAEQNCACGRHFPILEGVDGRVEDFCFTADGRRIVRFDTVFKGVVNIRQAQVIQERIDLFTVNVVPAKGFNDADVEQIQANMRLHVGSVNVTVQTVNDIPRSASGKFRAVVCRLSEDERNRLTRIAPVRSA